MTICLACRSSRTKALADLGTTPVLNGVMFDDRASARAATLGRLDLAVCLDCGHVFNVAYDPGLLDYDAEYDNSLHFSPSFQAYADELAHRLVDTYDLHNGLIVEIGSGKGDFLESITALSGSRGVGYDPSTMSEREIPNVTLVSDYYRPGQGVEPYDLLVCRHVLEHLERPEEILVSLRQTAPADAIHYFEVPAAEFDFGPDGLWDFIYPHVSYFSRESLCTLLMRCGFDIIASGRSFSDQFHWVEVRAGAGDAPVADPGAHLAALADFAERRERTVSRSRSELSDRNRRGQITALWGAGARGVAFLNAVDPDAILLVVDLNPRKWGRYLPGTGHEVIPPEALASSSVTQVLITNPAYEIEISEHLQRLGIHASVSRV